MSAVAQALTTESAVYLNARQRSGTGGSRYSGRERSTSNGSLLSPMGAHRTLSGSEEDYVRQAKTRAVTPPPRKDSLEGSPRMVRQPLTSSPRSFSSGKLVDVPPRSSSVSPSKGRPPTLLHPDDLPSPPVFIPLPSTTPRDSPEIPSAPARSITPLDDDGSTFLRPFPSSPLLIAPPDAPQKPQNNGRTSALRNTTSASSAESGLTSNSSHLSPPMNLSPYPPSNASMFSLDPEATSALIQALYARLDAQGVPGDGWDEGKERSRDGIITREAAMGGNTVRPKSRNGLDIGVDAEAKADHVLRRVDRYGFFSSSHPAALSSQHNRLATLSSAPFQSLPSTKPRPSKPSSSASSATLSPDPTCARPSQGMRKLNNRASMMSLLPATEIDPEVVALETKRIDKWASMLNVAKRDSGGNSQDWVIGESWWSGRVPGGGGGNSGKYRKLQRRVFKGVPDRWRRAVWGLLMEKMAKEVASGQVKGRGGGRERVPTLEELKREYEELLEQPSVQDVQIDLDVPRTISGHVQFHTRYGQGQRALFHVLHAFGLRSEDIGGYCQGMGPIAATLLCYFEPERAYAGLCRLFDQYQLGHIFAPGFPGLVEAFYVQEKLVALLMPNVHAAFAEHFISTSSYATKWYITLFANSVPFATQLRLWDGLLLEGVDFLIITALAIIWHFRDEFTSPSASFESVLTRLSSFFFVESDDALLRWIRKTLRIKGLREKMNGWRREWKGYVQDGTSGDKLT